MGALVLGGNGMLGLEFVEAALASNLTDLTLVNRGTRYWASSGRIGGVRQLRCDRRLLSSCAGLLERSYAMVVDFSAGSYDNVRVALRLLRGAARYVLVSSSIAYVPSIPAALSCRLNPFRSRSCGPPFAEADVAFGTSRGRLARFIADADPYMAGKLGAEEALWQAGSALCTTAARLPYVIGRRDSTHRLTRLLLSLEAGDLRLSPASRVPISFVDARAAASALVHLLSAPADRTCGRAFNVANPPVSLEQLVLAAAASFGSPTANAPRPALLPPTAAERVYDAVAASPLLPLTLDTSLIEALGWTPPRSLAAAAAEAGAFVRRGLLADPSAFPMESSALRRILTAHAHHHPLSRPLLLRYFGSVRSPELTPPCSWEEILERGRPDGGQCAAELRRGFARVRRVWLVGTAAALLLGLLLPPRWSVVALCAGAAGWACALRAAGGAVGAQLWPYAALPTLWLDAILFPAWLSLNGIPFYLLQCMSIGAEVALGAHCVWLFVAERRSQESRASDGALDGHTSLLPRALLLCAYGVVFTFLHHKLAGRFHGYGLSVSDDRPAYESRLPLVILSHEAFVGWPQALSVGVYGLTGYAVAVALPRAIGHASAGSWRALAPFLLMAACVSIFESHHVGGAEKTRAPCAGRACVFVTTVWAAFLPCAALLKAQQLRPRALGGDAAREAKAGGASLAQAEVEGLLTQPEARATQQIQQFSRGGRRIPSYQLGTVPWPKPTNRWEMAPWEGMPFHGTCTV